MMTKDPTPVIFGRSSGYTENRIQIIVGNYRSNNLSRELAVMNLKQHGKDDKQIDELLGPDKTPIVDKIIAPHEPSVIVDHETMNEPTKRRRGRPRKLPELEDTRLP